MKKVIVLLVCFVITLFIGQFQIDAQEFNEKQSIKERMLKKRTKRNLNIDRGLKKNNQIFFSQGSIFFTSNKNEILAHFILKNNDGNGPAITNAKVLINNKQIVNTDVQGEYKGSAPVIRDHNNKYIVNVRIETTDRRVLTATCSINSVLKMEVSNLFPKDKTKMDVGTPVKLKWIFIPKMNIPVNIEVVETGNNEKVFYKSNYYKQRVIIPVKTIRPRRHIRIKVYTPLFNFKYNEATHKDSSIKIHVKDVVFVNTFG